MLYGHNELKNNWNKIWTFNEYNNRNYSLYKCLHQHLHLAELQTELLPVSGENRAFFFSLSSVVEHRIQ